MFLFLYSKFKFSIILVEILLKHKRQTTIDEDFICEKSTYTIKSENFPSKYPSQTINNVIFNFNSISNTRLEIKFKNFDIEYSRNCSYDYLVFSDDKTSKALCGSFPNSYNFSRSSNSSNHIDLMSLSQETPDPDIDTVYFVKPVGSLLMQFRADGRLQSNGFKIETKFLCPTKSKPPPKRKLEKNNKPSRGHYTCHRSRHSSTLPCSNNEIKIETNHHYADNDFCQHKFYFPKNCKMVIFKLLLFFL